VYISRGRALSPRRLGLADRRCRDLSVSFRKLREIGRGRSRDPCREALSDFGGGSADGVGEVFGKHHDYTVVHWWLHVWSALYGTLCA
jgi:hypothetical protein